MIFVFYDISITDYIEHESVLLKFVLSRSELAFAFFVKGFYRF